jgi:4-amino-4-deoxychorismate lyase
MGVDGQELVWIDGQRSAELSLPDRMVCYGDGLFETLRWQSGVLQLAQRHWRRLGAGCRVLGLPEPKTSEINAFLVPVLAELRDQGVSAAVVRYALHRAGRQRAYRPDPYDGVRTVISAQTIDRLPVTGRPPAKLALAQFRYAVQPALAQIKHANRLEQVLAAAETPPGCEDVVVRDSDGFVIGCSAANIFWRKGDVIMVPQVDRCGIAGTVRQWLLDKALPRFSHQVELGRFTLSELLEGDEIWITSSLRGVHSVQALAERRWSDFSLAEGLRALWHADAEVRCAS